MEQVVPSDFENIVDSVFGKHFSEYFGLQNEQKYQILDQLELYIDQSSKTDLEHYLFNKLQLDEETVKCISSDFYKFLKKQYRKQRDQIQSPFRKQEYQQALLDLNQIKCSIVLEYQLRLKLCEAFQVIFPEIYKDQFHNQPAINSPSISIEDIREELKKYKYDQNCTKILEQIDTITTSQQKKVLLWKKLINQVEILNLAEIVRYKDKMSSKQELLRNKQGILIAGISGVGKTTFFLSMADYKLRLVDATKYQQKYEPEDQKVRQQYQISSQTVSCTKQIGILPANTLHTNKKQIMLIDTGGFQDSRSAQTQIINGISTIKYIQKMKNLRIVIIISRNILGQRGSGLKRFGKIISRYFKDFQMIQRSISYILTKFDTADELNQVVDCILDQIESQHTLKFNNHQNYYKFFYHLKQSLDQGKYRIFIPLKSKPRDILKNFILNNQPILNPAQQLNTSFTNSVIQKITIKAKYLQKMIQATYRKGQYEKTHYYFGSLQQLEGLDEENPFIDSVARYQEWIDEQNSLLVKNFQENLRRLFQKYDVQSLQEAFKIKQKVEQIDVISDSQFSPKQLIQQIITLKVKQIKDYFFDSKSEGLTDNNIYRKASLLFLKKANQPLYSKIIVQIKQDEQKKRLQFESQLHRKQLNQENIIECFQEYMQSFKIDDIASENRKNQRIIEIKQMIEPIFEKQFNEVLEILKLGYEDQFDDKIINQIKQVLKKHQILSKLDFRLNQTSKINIKRIINQMKKLIAFYIKEHKSIQDELDFSRFKKIKNYQSNYDKIMTIHQISKDSQISNLLYKIGISEFMKNLKKSLQNIIQKLNQQINSYYDNKQYIDPYKIKKIFKNIINHLNFLTQLGSQYEDKIKNINNLIEDGHQILLNFIERVNIRVKKQSIRGYQINLKLIVDFALIEELLRLRLKDTHMVQVLQNTKFIIKQKFNTPLRKVFKSDKNYKFSSYEFTNLTKLLEYYQNLDEKIEKLQDKRNLEYDQLILFRQNTQLIQLLNDYIQLTVAQFQHLKRFINQKYFSSTISSSTSLKKSTLQPDLIIDSTIQDRCVEYIKTFYIIQGLCNQYAQDFDQLQQFNYETRQSSNLKYILIKRLEQINLQLQKKGQTYSLSQLTSIANQYLSLNQIYNDSKKPQDGNFKFIMDKINDIKSKIRIQFKIQFQFLNRQLEERKLNVNFKSIYNLSCSKGYQNQGSKELFQQFLIKIDKCIDKQLSKIMFSQGRLKLQEMLDFIQKVRDFQQTSKQIQKRIPSYKTSYSKEWFKQVYIQFFQELFNQLQKNKKQYEESLIISQVQIRKLEARQKKIQFLLPAEYKIFLREKKKKSLKDDFKQFQNAALQKIGQNYLQKQKQIILDESLAQFYQKTSVENKRIIDEKIQAMYQQMKHKLQRLIQQNTEQYQKELSKMQQKIYLIPKTKQKIFTDFLIQRQKEHQHQKNQLVQTAKSLKQSKNIIKLLDLIQQTSTKNHQELTDRLASIVIQYFDEEIRCVELNKVQLLNQIIMRNIIELQQNSLWKFIKQKRPNIYNRFIELQKTIKQSARDIISYYKTYLKDLPAEYVRQNYSQHYSYQMIVKYLPGQQAVNYFTEIGSVILAYKTIFKDEIKDVVQNLNDILGWCAQRNIAQNQLILQQISKIKSGEGITKQIFLKSVCQASILHFILSQIQNCSHKLQSRELLKKKDLLLKAYEQVTWIDSINHLVQYFKQIYQQVKSLSLRSQQLKTKDIQGIKLYFMNYEKKITILDKYGKIIKDEALQNVKSYIHQNVKKQFQKQYEEFHKKILINIQKSFSSISLDDVDDIFSFLNIDQAFKQHKFSFFTDSTNVNLNTVIDQKFQELKSKLQSFNKSQSKNKRRQIQDRMAQIKKSQKSQLNQIQSKAKQQLLQYDTNLKLQLKTQLSKIQQARNKKAQEIRIKKQFQALKLSKQNDVNTQTQLKITKVKQYHQKRYVPLEESLISFVQDQLINFLIIYRKNTSSYRIKSPQYIKQLLDNISKHHGSRVIKIIYDMLSQNDSNYAQLIKNQQKIFQRFRVRKFRELTKTQDIYYLLKNIPQLSNDKVMADKLQKKFLNYQQKYEEIIKKYEMENGEQSAKNEIIDKTQAMAEKIKKQFDRDRYASTDNQQFIAYIFGVWTIISCSPDQFNQIQFVYEPHPAQILAIFLLLDFVPNSKLAKKDKTIQKCLVQVSTGEGKSIVLAGLSAYLALVGFEVYQACYSKYLSHRDYKQFQKLFDVLRIKNKIHYNTFPQICRQVLNQNSDQTFNDKIKTLLQSTNQKEFQKLLQQLKIFFQGLMIGRKKQRKIMIIDEADVFINEAFLGQTYSPSINLKSPEVVNILNYIWTRKQSDHRPHDIQESEQFKKLVEILPQFKNIFQNQLNGMIRGVKNFCNDNYRVVNDKIYYRQNDGLSSAVHHGYNTIYSYFHQHQVTKQISYQSFKNMIAINLIIGHFSYAKLPTYFQSILGVTGTLKAMNKCQQKILQQQYGVSKTFIMPSIYGLNTKRVIKFFKINKMNLYKALVQQIKEQHIKKRPIIVFFKSKGELNDFFISKEVQSLKENICLVTYESNEEERDFRIQTATFENKITLMTEDFSRGTDFKINAKQSNDYEGLHVIQTFLPTSLCDYIQFTGRSGRQGKKGSASIFHVIPQQQQKFQGLVILTQRQGQALIEKLQNNHWNKQYADIKTRIQKANKNHDETIQLFISSRQPKDLLKKIYEWNQEPQIQTINVRTVLALDGTSSMLSVFKKVKDVLKQTFPRLYSVLKKSDAHAAFEIKIVIYRNYNSRVDLVLQATNFENKADNLIDFLNSISADGGMGNEAIQLCFQYVNNLDRVDQVIIIGDAAANTPQETSKRRKQKAFVNWTEKGFPQTDIQKQTDKLVQKGVPVHSYFLKADKYFKNLSEVTKGKSDFFDIRHKDASQNLTNFISKLILQKLDQAGNMGGQLVKFYEDKYVKRYVE